MMGRDRCSLPTGTVRALRYLCDESGLDYHQVLDQTARTLAEVMARDRGTTMMAVWRCVAERDRKRGDSGRG